MRLTHLGVLVAAAIAISACAGGSGRKPDSRHRCAGHELGTDSFGTDQRRALW